MPQEPTQSDPNQNPDPNAETSEELEGNKGEYKAPESQDALDRIIQRRLDRDRKDRQDEIDRLNQEIADLKTKPSEEKPDDKPKSELEKQLEAMEAKMQKLEADRKAEEDRKARVAAVEKAKLDPEWADLISGTSAKEWADNAKKASDLVNKLVQKRSAPDPGTGQPSFRTRGQQQPKAPEFTHRARGKQVEIPD